MLHNVEHFNPLCNPQTGTYIIYIYIYVYLYIYINIYRERERERWGVCIFGVDVNYNECICGKSYIFISTPQTYTHKYEWLSAAFYRIKCFMEIIFSFKRSSLLAQKRAKLRPSKVKVIQLIFRPVAQYNLNAMH